VVRKKTASPLSCEEGLGRYHIVQFRTVLQSSSLIPRSHTVGGRDLEMGLYSAVNHM